MIVRSLFVLLLLLCGVAGAAQPDLLEPDKAFRFSARLVDATNIEVRYQVAPGYYLYRDKFEFKAGPQGVTLGAVQLPPGKMKKDEFFGEVETYRGEVAIRLPFANAANAPAVELAVTSQGCADAGVCYVPYESRAVLRLAAAGSIVTEGPMAGPGPDRFGARLAQQASKVQQGDDARIAELFSGEFWLLIASFFGFGLLLSLTPCVLPMVPILSGIIVGHGRRMTRLRGFLLSGCYVLGMALAYAAAGVAAGLTGTMLSAVLQNPWVVGTFSAVFFLLGLAMLGVYKLQMPAALQTRIAEMTNRVHTGHYSGVFFMGVVAALIVGPCVAAPLAGALLYISQSGDVVLGGTALFVMALGMGVPLLVVGASAGALLPKAGPWMETVMRFFGVLLIGLAIYMASPLVPVQAQMFAWAALLILTGIHLRAIDPLPAGAHGFQRFAKGVGMVALFAGVVYLVGGFAGSRDVLQPLAGLRAADSTSAEAPAVRFQRVASLADVEAAVKAAAGKPVVLDFYADWCVTCKEMERDTFSDPAVRARFAQMVKLQADVTAGTPEHRALLARFRLFGPPGIVFFDRDGREIQGLRVIGFQPPAQFAAVLDQAIAFR